MNPGRACNIEMPVVGQAKIAKMSGFGVGRTYYNENSFGQFLPADGGYKLRRFLL
jgi:hypothetical protein